MKKEKLRTRQVRPTNKSIIQDLGIAQWKFYRLLKQGVINRDMTLEEMRASIKAGEPRGIPYAPKPEQATVAQRIKVLYDQLGEEIDELIKKNERAEELMEVLEKFKK